MSFFEEEQPGHMQQVMFRWQRLWTLHEYMDFPVKRYYVLKNTIFMITGGQGVWNIGDQSVAVRPGMLVGITAGTLLEAADPQTIGAEGWAIEFYLYRTIEDDQEGIRLSQHNWRLPGERAFLIASVTDVGMKEKLQNLSALDKRGLEQEVERHQVLYALLADLYQAASGKNDNRPAEDQAVLRSVHYMQQHYDQPLTCQALSNVAGLSLSHYSRTFKAMTGKPPLEFLNRYRMFRAQECLLKSTASAQTVAAQVGYEDAAYFSRRFKQMTGVTPKEFVRTIANRSICVLSPLYAEILIALGIVPRSVVIVPLLLPKHQQELFDRYQVRMIPTSQFSLDIQAIRAEQPQFIASQPIQEKTQRELMEIAPVVSGLSRDLHPAIAQLAAMFRKEDEAAKLYDHIRVLNERARLQLENRLKSRMTVMVLRVEPDGYRYMGAHANGLSRILYRELGLAIPSALNKGQEWFNPLRLEQLPLADPDFIWVENRIMEGGDTTLRMKALGSSPYWRALKAVQSNRIFKLDTRLWIGCGPMGYSIILGEIVDALTSQ